MFLLGAKNQKQKPDRTRSDQIADLFIFNFLQVIYKKFQIPCPFEEYSSNSTAAHHTVNVSNHVVHADQEVDCSPRMFTMNSQVSRKTSLQLPLLQK